MFEGMEFVLWSVFNGNMVILSCEGEFDFVEWGDFLVVVMVCYDVGVFEFFSNLVVVIFNYIKVLFCLIS